MEPDLVIVVGHNIEFYHYQSIVCQACPFIDTMLAADMKESREKRITLPQEMSPEDWLNVYKLLDLTVAETEKDNFAMSLWGRRSYIKPAMKRLFKWLDYLGMESIVKKYDTMVAVKLETYYADVHKYPKYVGWCSMKTLPCKLIKKVMTHAVMNSMGKVTWNLSRGRTSLFFQADNKMYFLDDEIGEDLWLHFLSIVTFPKRMTESLDRKTVVESPLLEHMIQLCGKGMKKPERIKVSWDDISEDSDNSSPL